MSLPEASRRTRFVSPDLVLRMGMNGAFRLLPNVLWPTLAMGWLGLQDSRSATALFGLPLVTCWSLGVGAGLAELRPHRRHALLPGRRRLFMAGLTAALILSCGIAVLTLSEPGAWPLILAGGLFGVGLGLLGGWRFAPGALMLLAFPALMALDEPLALVDPAWALSIGAVVFVAGSCWHLRPVGDILPPARKPSSDIASGPIRHGHAFSAWGIFKWMVNGVLFVGALLLFIERDLSLERVGRMVNFLVLWSIFGIMALFGELWRARGCVRRLSLLPGWSRQRLFSHFDRSLWRAVAWLFAAMLTALALAWQWGPATADQVFVAAAVWLATVWVINQMTLLMLTLERFGHTVPISLALMPVMLPAFTMASVHRVDADAAWIPVLLIGYAALGAWLRYCAKQRWESVSLTAGFNRT